MSGTAALIIAYRRSENLEILLSKCVQAGFRQIYVSLDFPSTDLAREDVEACINVAKNYEANYPDLFRLRTAQWNLGCAISVLSACDWVFDYEEFVVVLEDDCLPSNDFFKFIADGKNEMRGHQNIFLLCGTQFAPEVVTHGKWHLSKYPLIWGWATSRDKWLLIKETYQALDRRSSKSGFETFFEHQYWKAGTRRALEGFVDAWDTPLVLVISKLNGDVLLPGVNLVQNIGNDQAATHTLIQSPWLNRPTVSYFPSTDSPVMNSEVDNWLRSEFYGISLRHLITTNITLVLDYVGIHKRLRKPLIARWLQMTPKG
jgi:hypothetical protein